MKPEGKWIFRTESSYLSEDDEFVEPYVHQKLIRNLNIIKELNYTEMKKNC
jgi:hypothetical protein